MSLRIVPIALIVLGALSLTFASPALIPLVKSLQSASAGLTMPTVPFAWIFDDNNHDCGNRARTAGPSSQVEVGRPLFTLPQLMEALSHGSPPDARRPVHAQAPRKDGPDAWCPNNSYYEFLPVYLNTVPLDGSAVSWEGSCFGEVTAQLMSDGDSGAHVILQARNPSSFLCSDALMFATRERLYFKEIMNGGLEHRLHILEWAQNEQSDVRAHGLQVYQLPCGFAGTSASLARTAELFVGEQMQERNAEFVRERMGWDIAAQPFGRRIPIDRQLIRSGDYFAITRLDGVDPLIMFGTGGHTGHSAVCLWDERDGELYVVESMDINPLAKSYWPPPYGVIKTPFDRWMQQVANASFLVALLPLRADLSARFNATAAWQWFNAVEGLPYGYENFLYSFIDTYPNRNFPMPAVDALVDIVFSIADLYLGSTSSPQGVYSLVIQGMNRRLSTNCTDMACVNAALDAAGRVMSEVMAWPERDEWLYNGHPSMVCSVLAFRVWQAGLGAALPQPIQATEQTPKDNYMLQIFDGAYFSAANCPEGGLQSTPAGTYCQLVGPYVLTLPGYNTVPPYAHMNERCPAQWPDYFRCPADNVQCC